MHNKYCMSTVLKRHSRGFFSKQARSDGSQNSQTGGWTLKEVTKGVQKLS